MLGPVSQARGEPLTSLAETRPDTNVCITTEARATLHTVTCRLIKPEPVVNLRPPPSLLSSSRC